MPQVHGIAVCPEDDTGIVSGIESVGLDVQVPHPGMRHDIGIIGIEPVFAPDADCPDAGVDISLEITPQIGCHVLLELVVTFHVTDIGHKIGVMGIPASIQVDAVGVVIVFRVVEITFRFAFTLAETQSRTGTDLTVFSLFPGVVAANHEAPEVVFGIGIEGACMDIAALAVFVKQARPKVGSFLVHGWRA